MRSWGNLLVVAWAAQGALFWLHAPSALGPGDPERGRVEIARAGCGACHVIPGIRGARGRVGPPLGDFRRRIYIAGRLPNTPEALALWIQDPPAIKPGTAMPAVGVDAPAARDMAAYLLQPE
jgi:cytochrome c2